MNWKFWKRKPKEKTPEQVAEEKFWAKEKRQAAMAEANEWAIREYKLAKAGKSDLSRMARDKNVAYIDRLILRGDLSKHVIE